MQCHILLYPSEKNKWNIGSSRIIPVAGNSVIEWNKVSSYKSLKKLVAEHCWCWTASVGSHSKRESDRFKLKLKPYTKVKNEKASTI